MFSFFCAHPLSALENDELPKAISIKAKCIAEELSSNEALAKKPSAELAETKQISSLLGHGLTDIFPLSPGRYVVSVDAQAAGKPVVESHDPSIRYDAQQYIGVVDTSRDSMDPMTWKLVGPLPPISKIAGFSESGELLLGLKKNFGQKVIQTKTGSSWIPLATPVELVAVDTKTGNIRELLSGVSWGAEFPQMQTSKDSLVSFRNWYPDIKPLALSDSIHLVHPRSREALTSIDTTRSEDEAPPEKKTERLIFGGANENFELNDLVKVVDSKGNEKIWSTAKVNSNQTEGAIIEVDPKNATKTLPRSVNPWIRAKWLAAAPDGKSVVALSERTNLLKNTAGLSSVGFDLYLLDSETGQVHGHVMIEKPLSNKGSFPLPRGVWTDGKTAFVSWIGAEQTEALHFSTRELEDLGVNPALVPNMVIDSRLKPIAGLPNAINPNSILFTDSSDIPSSILFNLDGLPNQSPAARFDIHANDRGIFHTSASKPFEEGSGGDGFFRGPAVDRAGKRIVAIQGNRLVELNLADSTVHPIAQIKVELDKKSKYPELDPSHLVLNSQSEKIFALQVDDGSLKGMSRYGFFSISIPSKVGFFGKLFGNGKKSDLQLNASSSSLEKRSNSTSSLAVNDSGTNPLPSVEEYSSAKLNSSDRLPTEKLNFQPFPKEVTATGTRQDEIVTGARLPSGETVIMSHSNKMFRISADGAKVLDTQSFALPRGSYPVQLAFWKGKTYLLTYIAKGNLAAPTYQATLFEVTAGNHGMELTQALSLGTASLHPYVGKSAILPSVNSLYVSMEDRLYLVSTQPAQTRDDPARLDNN
jgi:hypothetical protein